MSERATVLTDEWFSKDSAKNGESHIFGRVLVLCPQPSSGTNEIGVAS